MRRRAEGTLYPSFAVPYHPVELRNQLSLVKTRVNHNTIVYQYRSCTHCHCIVVTTRVNHNTIVYQYRSCTQCRCIVVTTRVNHNTIVYQYRVMVTTPLCCMLYRHTIHIQSYGVSTNRKSSRLVSQPIAGALPSMRRLRVGTLAGSMLLSTSSGTPQTLVS